MAPLDWVVGAVLLASFLLGVWRGLVYEVMSVMSWVAAFVLAQWLAADAAQWLTLGGASEPVRYAAGFALVFVAALFTGGLVAWLMKKLTEAVGLRPVDRTLGAVFGLLRGAVLVLALAVVVQLTPLKSGSWWTDSVTSGVATGALRALKPVAPGALAKYLPD
jgi:membrane protein required for colicin V production